MFTANPPVCDDNNCATDDSYDPDTCECVFTANPPACDDNNCATDDSYDPDTCECVFTANPPVCDDNNCATDDSYDPDTCDCVFTANPPVCDDNNCATDDSYDPDTCECVFTANPPVCDDDNCATNDSYDPDTCECIFEPGPPVCDDNNCATDDTYNEETCDCVYTPNPPVCDDNNCATDDSYDPDTCECVFTDNPPVCDDNNCATDDSYDPDTCDCVFTDNPPVCDDNNCATDDSYDLDTCECVYTANPPVCDDDNCATNDSYDPDTCECIFTPGPPACDDNDPCTIDSYDAANCECIYDEIWLDFEVDYECTEEGIMLSITSEVGMGTYALEITPTVPGLPATLELAIGNEGVAFLTDIPNGDYQLVVSADADAACQQVIDFEIDCCAAESGTAFCSERFCEGENVNTGAAGSNTSDDYSQYYIVASGTGEIIAYNEDGDFGTSLPPGEYCLVSLNIRNEDVPADLGDNISNIEGIEGCWDLSDCRNFEVLPQPVLSLEAECQANGDVVIAITGTGGSGSYLLTGPGITGTQNLAAGVSFSTEPIPSGSTMLEYTIVDVLNEDCLDTRSIVGECCAPEAGTVSCSDIMCEGDELIVTYSGANDGPGYGYLYLITDQNGKILNISSDGSFFLEAGLYCVYGYSYQTGGDASDLPMLGQNIAALNDNCYDVSDECYLVSVLSEPVLSVDPVCSGFEVSFEVSATGGSGTYIISSSSGQLPGFSIVATVGTTYTIPAVAADGTAYTFFVRDILDQDCTDQVTVAASCCAAESGIPTFDGSPVCAHDLFTITNNGYTGVEGYEQIYLVVSHLGLVVNTSTNETLNIDLAGEYCIYALNYKLSDPPVIPTIFQSIAGLQDPDAEGCFDLSDCLPVTVSPKPGPPQVVDASVCEGEAMTLMVLNANPAYVYSWFETLTSTEVIGVGTSFTPTTAGTYYVMATNTSACSCVRTPVVATEFPTPAPDLGDDLTICGDGSSVTLDAGAGFNSYQWSTGDSDQTVTVAPTISTTYVVTVTDSNNCTGTGQVTVNVDSEAGEVTLADVNACAADLPVVLDAGAGYASYQWSTGSTDQTISVNAAATYSLTVTDAAGCTATAQSTVEIADPQVSLGPDILTCDGVTTIFSAVNAEGATYLWSTGDMTQNLMVLSSGTYALTITDSNGCQASDEIEVLTFDPPTVDLGADISVCDASGGITLDAGAGFSSYQWSTGGTSQTEVVSPATSTTYTVIVTDSNNCTATDQVTVNIVNEQPSVMLADAMVCADDLPATLDAGPGFVSYQWSTGASGQTISVSPATDTVYTVTVTDAAGCTNSAQATVFVSDPQVDLGPDITACDDGTGITLASSTNPSGVSYLWSTGATSAAIVVTTAGTYSLTITDMLGCTATDDVLVTFNGPPTVILNGDVAACANQVPVFFGASAIGNGPFSYLWSNGDNTANTSTSTSGTYEVTVTDANGCSASSSINISVNSTPNFDLGPDLNLCASQTPFVLAAPAVPGATYQWSTGADTQTIEVTASGNYAVTITADDNCSGSDDVNITIHPLPTVDLGADTFVCSEDFPYTLSAPAASAYLWSTGETTQSISIASAGTYEVQVTDANGCSASDDIFIGSTMSATPVCQSDQTVCSDIATISVSIPFGVQGSWSLTSGAGTIVNPNSATTQVTGLADGDNVFTFSTSASGCTPGTCSTTVSSNQLTAAEAGPDQTICGSTAQLNATAPVQGTGQWSTTSAAIIADASSANSTVSNIPAGGAVFTWTVTDNGCQVSDDVSISRQGVPGLPAGASTYTACLGEYPTLILSAQTGEQIIEWYDDLAALQSNATPIHVGMMYQPNLTLEGTYIFYARLRNTVTGCIAADHLEVTVTIANCCAADAGTVEQSTGHCQGEAGVLTATVLDGSSSAPGDYFYTFILTDSESNTILQGPNASGQFDLALLAAGSYCIHGVSYADPADINSSAATVTQLVAAGACASISGCDAVVTVDPKPAAPIVGGNQAICAGEAIPTFTVSNVEAGISYNWYDAGGTLLLFNATSFTPPAGGTFTVYATNGTNCTSATSFSLTVTGSPAAPTANSQTVCEGQAFPALTVDDLGYMYYWYNDSGVLVALNSTSYTPSTVGNYYVQAVASGGCSSPQALVSLSLIPAPVAPIVANQEVCSGQDIPALTVQDEGYTYNWYDAANVLLASNATSYQPTDAGTFYVEASNGSCTSARVAATLTIYSSPTAPEVSSTLACEGEAIPAFEVNDLGYTYRWYDSSNTLVATGATFVPAAPGTYYVGAESGGCFSELSTVSFTQFERPAPPVVYSINVCENDPLPALIVEDAIYSYFWYDAQVGGTLLFEGLSYIPPSEGAYYVEARSTNGCASNRTTASINIISDCDDCDPDPGNLSGPGTLCSSNPVLQVSSDSSMPAAYLLNYFVVDDAGNLAFPFTDDGTFDFSDLGFGSYCVYAMSWKIGETMDEVMTLDDLFSQDCCFALSACLPVNYHGTPAASVISGPECNEDGSFDITVSATAASGSFVARLMDDGVVVAAMSNMSGGTVALSANGDGSNMTIEVSDQTTGCATMIDLGNVSCQECTANAGIISASATTVCGDGNGSVQMSTTGTGASYYYALLNDAGAVLSVSTSNTINFSTLAPGIYCVHGLAVGTGETVNTGATSVAELIDGLACYDLGECLQIQHVSVPVAEVTTGHTCNGDGTFTIGITVTGGTGTSSLAGIASNVLSGTEFFVTLPADEVTAYPIVAVDDNTGCSVSTVSTYGPVICAPPCPSELYLCTEPITTIVICPEFCIVDGIDDVQYGVLYTCSLDDDTPGCIEYTPLPGFAQLETMTITGCNTTTGECEVITAFIEVGNCNDNLPPVAENDSYTTNVNEAITVETVTNDSDPEGDSFTINQATNGINGTVTISGDGSVTYLPNSGFVGTDTFTYTICTEDGQCDMAIVVVEVLDSCVELEELCTGPITPILVCPSFCSLGSNAEIQSALTLYSCSISDINEPMGCFTYTPLPGFIAQDLVSVTACDDDDNCETVSFIIDTREDCADSGGDGGDGSDGGDGTDGGDGSDGGDGGDGSDTDPCDTTTLVCASAGVDNEYCLQECGIGPDASIIMVYTSTEATVTPVNDMCVSYNSPTATPGDIITVLIMDSFGFLETHYLYVSFECDGDGDMVADPAENVSEKSTFDELSFGVNYLAPVPVPESARLSIQAADSGMIQINVVDLNGRVVMEFSQSATAGENVYDIDMSSLDAGVYLLTLQKDYELLSTRFIKQ